MVAIWANYFKRLGWGDHFFEFNYKNCVVLSDRPERSITKTIFIGFEVATFRLPNSDFSIAPTMGTRVNHKYWYIIFNFNYFAPEKLFWSKTNLKKKCKRIPISVFWKVGLECWIRMTIFRTGNPLLDENVIFEKKCKKIHLLVFLKIGLGWPFCFSAIIKIMFI